MEPVRFLVFTFQLACVVAVFDLKEIPNLSYSVPLIWEISEKSSKGITIRRIQIKPEKITFHPKNGYIVLSKHYLGHIQEYYLVSEDSSMNIRHKTVEYVIELQNNLSSGYQQDIHLIRETYNQESFHFKFLFPQISEREYPKSISPRRLYRVSKVNGEVRFQQVPLQFSQLTSSDSFVYVDLPQIIRFIVNLDYSDEDSGYVARNIMSFIKLENKLGDGNRRNGDRLDLSHCYGSSSSGESLKQWDDCYVDFLSKLEGCPNVESIVETILNNEIEELPDVPDYQLYSPSESETAIMEREFLVESTDTFDFTAKACYIFVMPKVKEIFIYIRDFTHTEQLEKCLKSGEGFAAENKYLVSVFQKEYPATPFVFVFKTFRPLFLPNYKNPDVLSYFYKSSAELRRMRYTIKTQLS